ncbi:hypothetical protein INT48_001360 [Thamnidium elegans]|uniref:Uncharacterized protein n=1 Tax=Thamnidium elegans TaxID=101142 RepID=A0A8H7SW34_9FUNG|nr:hypothetical protein INT48_001360 [Thamnidium elegans]
MAEGRFIYDRFISRLKHSSWQDSFYPEELVIIDKHAKSDWSNVSTSSNATSRRSGFSHSPLVALGYVLTEQKFPYHYIPDREFTVERLMDVTKVTQKQLKRFSEAKNDHELSLKRVRSLTSAGFLCTETCLHKYQYQYSDDSDMTIPTPLNLPRIVIRIENIFVL